MKGIVLVFSISLMRLREFYKEGRTNLEEIKRIHRAKLREEVYNKSTVAYRMKMIYCDIFNLKCSLILISYQYLFNYAYQIF